MFYPMNVEKIKRLLLLTIAVMTAMMTYYIWRYNTIDNAPVEMEPVKIETDADVVATDVELTETTGDRVLWTLQARTAEIYTSEKETRLKDVEIDFFDGNGVKSMHLVSDHGIKDDKGNIMASGNVQAISYQKRATLKTSELVYDVQTQLITSDKHVVIEQGNIIISGDGLESDLSLSKARILRNVTTSVLEEGESKKEE